MLRSLTYLPNVCHEVLDLFDQRYNQIVLELWMDQYRYCCCCYFQNLHHSVLLYCHNFASERKNKNFNLNVTYNPHFEQQRPAAHAGEH